MWRATSRLRRPATSITLARPPVFEAWSSQFEGGCAGVTLGGPSVCVDGSINVCHMSSQTGSSDDSHPHHDSSIGSSGGLEHTERLRDIAGSLPPDEVHTGLTMGSQLYDVNGSAPYPIWWFDPEGSAYPIALNIAKNSSECLQVLQSSLDLPWWGTIMLGSLLVRLAFLPLNAYSIRNAARFQDAKDDIGKLQRSYKTALVRMGDGASRYERFQAIRIYMSGLRASLQKVNCYPWRTLATPLAQMPVLMSGVLGARHLVYMGDESFERGGMYWFQDLTVADPTYTLPIIAFSLSYLVLEVGFGSTKRGAVTSGGSALMGSVLVNKIKSGMQMVLIASSPMMVTLPAGIFIGWISSSIWSILYIKGIRRPASYKFITGRDIPTIDDSPMENREVFEVTITDDGDDSDGSNDSEGDDGSSKGSGSSEGSSKNNNMGSGDKGAKEAMEATLEPPKLSPDSEVARGRAHMAKHFENGRAGFVDLSVPLLSFHPHPHALQFQPLSVQDMGPLEHHAASHGIEVVTWERDNPKTVSRAVSAPIQPAEPVGPVRRVVNALKSFFSSGDRTVPGTKADATDEQPVTSITTPLPTKSATRQDSKRYLAVRVPQADEVAIAVSLSNGKEPAAPIPDPITSEEALGASSRGISPLPMRPAGFAYDVATLHKFDSEEEARQASDGMVRPVVIDDEVDVIEHKGGSDEGGRLDVDHKVIHSRAMTLSTEESSAILENYIGNSWVDEAGEEVFVDSLSAHEKSEMAAAVLIYLDGYAEAAATGRAGPSSSSMLHASPPVSNPMFVSAAHVSGPERPDQATLAPAGDALPPGDVDILAGIKGIAALAADGGSYAAGSAHAPVAFDDTVVEEYEYQGAFNRSIDAAKSSSFASFKALGITPTSLPHVGFGFDKDDEER